MAVTRIFDFLIEREIDRVMQAMNSGLHALPTADFVSALFNPFIPKGFDLLEETKYFYVKLDIQHPHIA